MKRTDIKILPNHYDTYINKVEDIELTDALEKYGKPYFLAERDRFIALGEKVYAPGKWTVKDIIQHIIDCERVFSYRAMRFARNDKTLLPPFEENDYGVTANANQRNLDDLLEEFYAVRESTIRLFKSFTNEMLLREGKLTSGDILVVSMGFAITGHSIHHIQILKERYYVL